MTPESHPSPTILRRFVAIDGWSAHYLKGGEGPPVVMFHSANASAKRELLPLIKVLAQDHSVYAFDLPGHGDTEPLPGGEAIDVPIAAEHMLAVFDRLGLDRFKVYGSHTGGALAMEIARQAPDRVAALIIDGLPVFSEAENELLLSDDYLSPLKVKSDGSHLTSIWVKQRDALTWFPWCRPAAANRLKRPFSFPAPASVHDGALQRLLAGNGYRAIYGAAFRYPAVELITSVTIPTTIMAAEYDILFPYLDRLPELPPNQKLERHLVDEVAYVQRCADAVRAFALDVAAPAELPLAPRRDAINRRYIDCAHGQLLMRSSGEGQAGTPLLLLHDGFASSRVFEPLMRRLATGRPVYAIDLPGSGASDPLPGEPSAARIADAIEEAWSHISPDAADLYAVGAGAAVALALAGRPAFATGKIVLEAPDFFPAELAERLREGAAPLAAQWHGGHLNQLWLMLRDAYCFWPWFDKSKAAERALDGPEDWGEFHARVVDVLRNLDTAHVLSRAALEFDWSAVLARIDPARLVLAAIPDEPRRPHVEAAGRAVGAGAVAPLPRLTDAKAQALAACFAAHGSRLRDKPMVEG